MPTKLPKMKAKKSELQLKDFAIIDSKCEFIPFEEEEFNFEIIQESHSIDIDFDISKNDSEEDTTYAIISRVTINEEKKSGYYIHIESCCVFSLPDSKLDSKSRVSLINSAIAISITNTRSYIANVTSYMPFGKFSFAAIDMTDLLNQKAKLATKEA